MVALPLLALVAGPVKAQLELKAGNFNAIFVATDTNGDLTAEPPSGPPTASSPAPTSGQFSAVGAIAGSAGPLSTAENYADRYSSNSSKSIILTRATIGGAFASGVPRYAMGEVIVAPLTQVDGVTPASPTYWRIQPVFPGEIVPGVNGGNPLIPTGTVTVTAASTNSTSVAVASVPPELVLGATLLGQPVTNLVGTTVTLGGNANATISSDTPSIITPALTYYYSPHAEKVFATQPGRVTITWVTRVPVSGSDYGVKTETFAVSSTTNSPIRTIYWTEGSFDGPEVEISDGRITSVNPVYYSAVPKAVPEEVSIPGYNPASPNLKTISFDKYNGLGELHAYNVEGRIFVEYLGNVRLAGNIYEHVGFDVVDIKRVPTVNYASVNLGEEIRPHDNDSQLIASPILAGAQNAANYYGTLVRPDNTSAYFAERTTSPAKTPDDGEPASNDAFNKVVFYWLETGSFSIRWPKFQDRYWLRWSPDLEDYAHYSVDGGGSTTDTGISFNSGTLPQLVFQDDPAQSEAAIDLTTQRFHVAFSAGDLRNRSLLKFNGSGKTWYVNVYSQAEDREVEVATQSPSRGLLLSTYDSDYGDELLGPISNLINTIPTASTVVTSPINYSNNFALPGLSNGDTFSLLWQGYFDASEEGAGDYTFGTSSDDGSVIYLDLNNDGDFADPGELVVDNRGYHAPQERKGTVALPASLVRIAIGYYEATAGEEMLAKWKKGTDVAFSDLEVIEGTIGPFYPPVSAKILSLASTAGLEKGMVLQGTGVTILRIINGTSVELSEAVELSGEGLIFTVESDGAQQIDATVNVGDRLVPPPGHQTAGYISGGTGYYPEGYLNPFTVGVPAANMGAIIPVNARPGDDQLTVRWFKKIAAPGPEFSDFYVPGKVGRYTIVYPASTDPEIVIASGVGTDDLTGGKAGGSIYYQNDRTLPGYNPNEEHSLLLGGRGYSLREDLNVTSGENYTSEPFLLLAYTSPADQRPAMQVYKVERTDEVHDFNFDAVAGTLLVKPYPLPLMPQPLIPSGTTFVSKDLEIESADMPINSSLAGNPAYEDFTFQDRKGFTWVARGPHDEGTSSLSMQLYYVSRDGFFVPGLTEQPEAGTILPFLRNPSRSGQTLNLAAIDNGAADEPLTINYFPQWPSQAPELRVAETLALPKFGLPQVRGQASAEVYYQQSIANAASGFEEKSVILHDPTREKTVALDAASIGLTALPSSLETTDYQGLTYFQGLAPHLQERVYMDALRGTKGTLVLVGEFHDEPAGEDYLDLNVLTVADVEALKGLVDASDPDKAKWDSAIIALSTRVETFKENPALAGNYIVDTTKSVDVGPSSLAEISEADTAVDSYAVTATGKGAGFVTMVFGNGNAFTDEGEPVQVKVFKVVPQLYTGDLKAIASSNPLDEQVTLRHSGDFAGKPEDYEFEWRWTTGAATAPAVYTTEMTTRIGDSNWAVVSDPGSALPSAAQYAAAVEVPFPRGVNVHPGGYTSEEKDLGLPSVVMKSASGVDFSGKVPGEIVFSVLAGDLDGFVLYVNGVAALAWQAPNDFTLTNPTSGLAANALARQFAVPSSYFSAGSNRIEVALFTGADPGVISTLNFRLQAAEETDAVETSGVWQPEVVDNEGVNTNQAPIGGATSNPFGGPQFVLNDRWFTMRYRAKAGTGNIVGSETWSRWMPPQFVEGWIKRVLAGINPFEQRVKDLFNNEINTDVSVITQAGTRWEGDVALTLDNIGDIGLIAIYETVLNRAKAISIDANTNDPDTNNALILAAGYLNDLYTLLGNEAYADAANPTISIDDQEGATQVNTSRFSFEGQVGSSLDEELALLRGRDDLVSPGVGVAPAYNRLYWNYTGGINGGEAIYALNYNIREKVGSETADGVIDEADAQKMFPQGHGDSYGHYLTALTGYYKLLTNANFTWTPRAEAVSVLGQPVTIDYFDERKFSAAAGNLARTAQQTIALTWRKSYKDDSTAGWSHLHDQQGTNPQTGVIRRQGLDEWVSRGTQGALYHWAVANALLPVEDLVNTGIQKIDRSTVPELAQLPSFAEGFQTSIDNANAHLNPLGLSPDAIAFDISPSELEAGVSHYEQISSRALNALNNASGAFNQAAVMTGSLRNQETDLDEFINGIVQQEYAYEDELVSIFGKPYSGDVGVGKLYAQGYSGPDLYHWYIVNRPNNLVSTDETFSVTLNEATGFNAFTGDGIADITNGLDNNIGVTQRTVNISPSRFVQYNDVWKPGGLGARPETGELQSALLDAQQTWLAISAFKTAYAVKNANLRQSVALFGDLVANHEAQLDEMKRNEITVLTLESVRVALDTVSASLDAYAEAADDLGDTLAEFFPRSVGLATDPTSGARGAAKAAGGISQTVLATLSIASNTASAALGVGVIAEEKRLEAALTELGFSHEERQAGYELSTAYRDHVSRASELMQLTLDHQRAVQYVENVLAEGNDVLAYRELFRQRAAAVIQGYRTRDLTFRLFRNEALEQYRTLFDLASRYSYLAAKSYDYETGLLGTEVGQEVFADIVASRSLGDLTGGVPQLTSSSLGDAGLAGSMAKLNADFSVAKGRLGINNPDDYGTVFSMRHELFRLLDDPNLTADDDAWQQTLEQHITSNLLSDPDVATYCRNLRKPDGTPVPGIVIPFSTSILHSRNFFGLDLAAGDHAFTPSNFATKINGVGIALPGYVGMDPYAVGDVNAGPPASGNPNALSATPYVYLVPCGHDSMLAPPLGDTNTLRTWKVEDQALPLPFNLGATDFNTTQFFSANGTLREQPWIIRKHQAFRPVADASFFYSEVPSEFTSTRLIGRSVWNSQWKLVIPAYTLLSDEQEALDRFAASVKDIQLFLRTYSHSGN